MTDLRAQDGFTLTELLVSCLLMIIVLSATLGALDVFGKSTAASQDVSDAQDKARTALDRLSWELRNGTAYQVGATGTSSTVTRATPWDVIFKTVDPTTTPTAANPNNVLRVRYCLDTSSNTLYRQTKRLPAAQPTVADCPSSEWDTQTVVATNVVNDGTRRAFTYNQQDEGAVSAPTPDPGDISSVRARLFVDPSPGRAPAETSLATGVFLRNQNQRPVARCTATPGLGGHVFLNGSFSTDPEGGVLSYVWFEDGNTVPLGPTAPNFDFAAPATGSHVFSVQVTDTSGLVAKTTCIPDPVVIQ